MKVKKKLKKCPFVPLQIKKPARAAIIIIIVVARIQAIPLILIIFSLIIILQSMKKKCALWIEKTLHLVVPALVQARQHPFLRMIIAVICIRSKIRSFFSSNCSSKISNNNNNNHYNHHPNHRNNSNRLQAISLIIIT